MDKDKKYKVIRLHLKNWDVKDIAKETGLSTDVIYRAIRSYTKLGRKYFNIKPGIVSGHKRILSPKQETELKRWLLEPELFDKKFSTNKDYGTLLTSMDIHMMMEKLSGHKLSNHAVYNYINRYFSHNLDYTTEYKLLKKVSNGYLHIPRQTQQNKFRIDCSRILDFGQLDGNRNLKVIVIKYRYPYQYYFYKGELTPPVALHFIKTVHASENSKFNLFIPNELKNDCFNDNTIKDYMEKNKIRIFYFHTHVEENKDTTTTASIIVDIDRLKQGMPLQTMVVNTQTN